MRHEHGFHDGETMIHLAQMAMAGATGTAAIATGTSGVLQGQARDVTVAGVLWNAANAGRFGIDHSVVNVE